MARKRYTCLILYRYCGLNKMKKVIYTCITGEYDDACAHTYLDDSWDYVMFTDNQYLLTMPRYMHWEIRPLQFNKMSNVKNARWHKINAHIIFPEYNYSLWIDANIVIQSGDFFERINGIINSDVNISVPLHPLRNCIYDEAKTIKDLKIDNKNTVNREMQKLHCWHYPKDNGLNETCIMLRQHNNKKIKRAQKRWWYMVKNYSKRDQLSYNWAMWRGGIKTMPMYSRPGEHRKSHELLFVHKRSHNQNPAENFDTWTIPYWMAKICKFMILHTKDKEDFLKKHCA